jgi:hypothetical protein
MKISTDMSIDHHKVKKIVEHFDQPLITSLDHQVERAEEEEYSRRVLGTDLNCEKGNCASVCPSLDSQCLGICLRPMSDQWVRATFFSLPFIDRSMCDNRLHDNSIPGNAKDFVQTALHGVKQRLIVQQIEDDPTKDILCMFTSFDQSISRCDDVRQWLDTSRQK